MKFSFAFAAILVSAAISLHAEEGLSGRTAGAGANAAKNATEKGAAESRSASTRGKEEATVGTLSEKPADSKVEHLAAVLKAHGKSYNLIATGEVADKLAELGKTGAKVRVMGSSIADGTGINVTRVTESGDGGDKPEKKKKKKAEDK